MNTSEQLYSRLLTIQQVAERLQVSRGSVYNLARRGDLTPLRVLSRQRFRPEDVDAYLDRHREPG